MLSLPECAPLRHSTPGVRCGRHPWLRRWVHTYMHTMHVHIHRCAISDPALLRLGGCRGGQEPFSPRVKQLVLSASGPGDRRVGDRMGDRRVGDRRAGDRAGDRRVGDRAGDRAARKAPGAHLESTSSHLESTSSAGAPSQDSQRTKGRYGCRCTNTSCFLSGDGHYRCLGLGRAETGHESVNHGVNDSKDRGRLLPTQTMPDGTVVSLNTPRDRHLMC